MKYWVALSAGFILAIVFHLLLGITLWNVVVYAALPGVIVHLLIIGGHGGTIMEERLLFPAFPLKVRPVLATARRAFFRKPLPHICIAQYQQSPK